MRAFVLERDIDDTGVSGVGRVAQGVEFDNGWCSMVWLTKHTSCAFYPSIKEVEAIHGHGGKTRIVFIDGERCLTCGHPLDAHWADNCGGCFTPECLCTLMDNGPRGGGWPADRKEGA